GVARAFQSYLSLDLLVFSRDCIDLFVSSGDFLRRVLTAQEPGTSLNHGIELPEQGAFPLEQSRVNPLTNIGASLGQHFQQTTSAGAFTRLQRCSIVPLRREALVESH